MDDGDRVVLGAALAIVAILLVLAGTAWAQGRDR